MNVLIYDEDSHFCRILATVLGNDGHQVMSVGDAATAMDLARSVVPDILIVSRDAANGTGLELIRQVRGRPDAARVAAVVVAGMDDKALRQDCQRLGVDEVLVRPFSVLDLSQGIGAIATRRSAASVPRPPAGLDLGNAVELARTWARRSNGVLLVRTATGSAWVTIANGGPADPAGMATLEDALGSGTLDFEPCDVDGRGDYAGLGNLLWQRARAHCGDDAAARLSGTCVGRSRYSEACEDLPIERPTRRLVASLGAQATPLAQVLSTAGLEVGEVATDLLALANLGLVVVQEERPAKREPSRAAPPRAEPPTYEVNRLPPPRSLAPDRGGPPSPARVSQLRSVPPPRSVPPGSVPPRSVPPRSVPPGSLPPGSLPPRSVPPRSVPPLTGARVLPKADDATLALRLRKEARLLEDQDAHTVLGVPQDSPAEMVARAGARMRERYENLTRSENAEVRVLAQAMLNRVLAAIADIESPAPQKYTSPSDEAFQAGKLAMDRGEWALADRYFARARDAEIDSPRNLAHLGWARFHNLDLPVEERLAEGIEFLRLAEEFDAGYADGQYFLAVVLHRGGDDEGANRRLRRAIKVQPDHAPALALARKLRRGPTGKG